jgi:hypothetical protein
MKKANALWLSIGFMASGIVGVLVGKIKPMPLIDFAPAFLFLGIIGIIYALTRKA